MSGTYLAIVGLVLRLMLRWGVWTCYQVLSVPAVMVVELLALCVFTPLILMGKWRWVLVQKYTVCRDGFPSTYPGEEIFFLSQLLHFGRNMSSWTLDVSELRARHALEQLFFSSGTQVFLLVDGFVSLLYSSDPCPEPVSQWLFKLLSSASRVSGKAFKTLWDITTSTLMKAENAGQTMWCPSLQNIISVFQNLGASHFALYPLEKPQKSNMFARRRQETQTHMSAYCNLLENSLNNIFKFLALCAFASPHSLSDHELLIIIPLLCRVGLDISLKNKPKEDLRQLLLILFEKLTDWQTQMPKLCLSISQISTHHHNLLGIVQLLPDTTNRGRQMKKQLSLAIILKLMGKNTEFLVWNEEKIMLSVLCNLLKDMKPSSLQQHLELWHQTTKQQRKMTPEELDWEAFYLSHTLLTLVNIVVGTETLSSDSCSHLHQLCVQLDRHITSSIRDSPFIVYHSKLKDLATYTHIRWKEMLLPCAPKSMPGPAILKMSTKLNPFLPSLQHCYRFS
ncbi:protein FAM178B [Pelodytes ibericus]